MFKEAQNSSNLPYFNKARYSLAQLSSIRTGELSGVQSESPHEIPNAPPDSSPMGSSHPGRTLPGGKVKPLGANKKGFEGIVSEIIKHKLL